MTLEKDNIIIKIHIKIEIPLYIPFFSSHLHIGSISIASNAAKQKGIRNSLAKKSPPKKRNANNNKELDSNKNLYFFILISLFQI